MKFLILMADLFASLLLVALLHEGDNASAENSEPSLENEENGDPANHRVEVSVTPSGHYMIGIKAYSSVSSLIKALESENAAEVALLFDDQSTLHKQALQLTSKLSVKFKIKYRLEKTHGQ